MPGQVQRGNDLWDIRRGRDQVQIVGSLRLLGQKNLGQSFAGNAFAEILLTDLLVLAKATLQIAAGEKDGAGTAQARNTGFFPMVK